MESLAGEEEWANDFRNPREAVQIRGEVLLRT